MRACQPTVEGVVERDGVCVGGALATFASSGRFPHARDPVLVNLLIKQFADRVVP